MTPLVLIVGFLGSGKTTFLKTLIPSLAERGIRPGLLINDYQNAKVDAEQFRDLIEEVRALSGDCVCCGSREQLFEELGRFSHEPGRVMIVETNGTTDSAALIEAIALDPALRQFTDPVQVTLIDGQRWQKRFWHNALEREQAKTASHIVISRADTVAAERLAHVRSSLAACGVAGRETDAVSFAKELVEIAAAASLRAERTLCGHGCGHEHPHEHPHEHHDHSEHAAHHFASCEFALPDFVEEKAFRALLRALPDEVLRAKGLVRFRAQADEYYVFQRIEQDVQFFPVGQNPRLKTPLVLFIGPTLDVSDLEERIASLRN